MARVGGVLWCVEDDLLFRALKSSIKFSEICSQLEIESYTLLHARPDTRVVESRLHAVVGTEVEINSFEWFIEKFVEFKF